MKLVDLMPYSFPVAAIINEYEFTGLKLWSPTFLAPRTCFVEDSFSTDWEWGRWFQDDWSPLHLLCTLFLLLLHCDM